MRQEQSHDSTANKVRKEFLTKPPFRRHEWDELLYKLSNSDDIDLKAIGKSLDSPTKKP